jgi:hypothetical protein
LPDDRTDAQRLELLRQAMSMSQREAERDLILQRARAVRIVETLRFVLRYVDQPEHTERACETIVELAHHRSLRDANQPEFHAALDKVIEVSGSETLVDRAQRYKKNQTWVRPKPSKN